VAGSDLLGAPGEFAVRPFDQQPDLLVGWLAFVEAVRGLDPAGVETRFEPAFRAFAPAHLLPPPSPEFINDHLWRYCQTRAIQFTRGRPYKKDDNAPIEQKNWTHVRRQLGYVR
jgi:hypothetical protein